MYNALKVMNEEEERSGTRSNSGDSKLIGLLDETEMTCMQGPEDGMTTGEDVEQDAYHGHTKHGLGGNTDDKARRNLRS